MTDVTISPIGRQLMSLAIAKIAYASNVQNRNIQMIQKRREDLRDKEEEFEMFREMSFDLTVSMLDKRYKESKGFINSGGSTQGRYKKSLSDDQKRLQVVMQKSMLKARTRFDKTVSSYNQLITDQKMQSAVRKLNLDVI
jgi:hypothetical protein